MGQLQRMDARLDTLFTELYKVNIHVGHIAWRQAIMGGYAPKAFPLPPLPVASKSKDDDDDDDDDGDDDDDASDDDDGDASSTDKMST